MGVRVDQILHGYAHGHSLLKSSVRLSNEAERLMLNLSDMSGPGMRSGFESYLTGYSLPKEQGYVLARTWHAPEMPRPGCVWTHSLVFQSSDLNRIRNLEGLTRHFQRPEQSGPSEAYDNWLSIEDTEFDAYGPQIAISPPNEVIVRAAIWFLYRQPEKPVYLVAKSAKEYEALVLALWLQQWPRLRQMFSFCTGALTNRNLRGKPLDIQVVPKEAVSELRGELGSGNVITSGGSISIGVGKEEWLSAAVEDLLLGWNRGIRTVAWKIAGQRVSDRASFPAVFHFASVAERKQGPFQNASDYIRAMAGVPPGVKMSASLLDALLEFSSSSSIGFEFSELDLLKALATDDLSHLILEDLRIAKRAQDLLQRDREAALELFSYLIAHNGTTEVGSRILMEISRGLEPQDIDSMARTQPGILSTVIKQRPQLATVSTIWRVHENLQAEIFDTLMTSNVAPDVLEQIVGAVLVSQTRVVPERAFQYGDSLVGPILDWLNVSNWQPWQVSRAWNGYLGSNASRVVAWLKEHQVRPPLLVLVAASIPADAPAVAALDLEIWLPLLEQQSVLEEHDATSTSAFLLALALKHCNGLAVKFIEESFERVHSAVAESSLDYEHWRPIESIAPPTAFWRSWDKCERIRAAVLDRFITCAWQPTSLLKVIKKVTTLQQLFALSLTTRPREEFLKRTAKASLELPLAPDYRAFLESYKSP